MWEATKLYVITYKQTRLEFSVYQIYTYTQKYLCQDMINYPNVDKLTITLYGDIQQQASVAKIQHLREQTAAQATSTVVET